MPEAVIVPFVIRWHPRVNLIGLIAFCDLRRLNEFERELIVERTMPGLSRRARARGCAGCS